MMQDVCRLDHLDHERGLPGVDFILRPDARENAVHQSNSCGIRRHERTHLRHQHNQCGLPQVGGFTGHIRSGDDAHDLTLFKDDIVRNVSR